MVSQQSLIYRVQSYDLTLPQHIRHHIEELFSIFPKVSLHGLINIYLFIEKIQPRYYKTISFAKRSDSACMV